jgi:hypothetical protein
MIRRFNHINSKTSFQENNNKVIEDLIRQQNEFLQKLYKEIMDFSIITSFLTVVIAFKPVK